VASNVVCGGTVVLTNVAGVLTNGSSFRLYSARNYSGAFSAILPSSPGPGLKWNTNKLTVDGVLRVVALNPPAPTLGGVQVLGTAIQISASGGIPYDPCYLLTTTNIGSPSVWEYAGTNWFDSAGNAIFNPPFSSEALRFFRLLAE
jgi:hypothetical protein